MRAAFSFSPKNSPVISVPTESVGIAVAVGCAVLLAIFTLAAELAAVAIVSVIVAARIRIEALVFPHVFAGPLGAVAVAKIPGYVQATPETVIAAVVAVALAIVVVVILSSRKTCAASHNCENHRCQC